MIKVVACDGMPDGGGMLVAPGALLPPEDGEAITFEDGKLDPDRDAYVVKVNFRFRIDTRRVLVFKP